MAAERSDRPYPRLRPLWAPLLGMMLSIPASYATANLPQSSVFSLLAAPVGILILVAACNAIWRGIAHGGGLRPAEFAILFAMVSVASAVSAEWTFFMHSNVHQLPFLAQGDPTVKNQILANLPDWLVAHDLRDVQDLQAGGRGVEYVASKWPVFAARYAAWVALIGAVAIACLCINSLLRRAWTVEEKLAFPIVQLPLALSQPTDRSVWTSKALWTAFALVLAIDLLNGFQHLYPSLPKIAIKQVIDTAPLLAKPPWNSLGELNIGIYPFLAAIGLFMPVDLLASLLLFFGLRKLTHLALGMAGVGQNAFSGTYFAPGAPWFEQQAWGAVIALFAMAMYFGRSHWKVVWSEIRNGAKADDGGWSSRGSAIALAICIAVVIGFGSVGAIPIGVMLVFTVLFLVFSVVLARLRAQIGPPTHEFAYFGPMGMLTTFGGTHWISERQGAAFSHMFLFMNRIARTHPGPTQLEALKLGQQTGASARTMLWGMAGAMILGLGLAYWFYLTKAYRLGAPIGATDGLGFYQNLRSVPRAPDPAGMWMVGVGFVVAGGLDILRTRFPAFWVHPAGYVLGITYGIDYYWFGLLIALLVKIIVQRYHGAVGFERLKQVAIGIMLAEYTAEALWMATALITKQSTYTIGFNDRSLGVQ